MSSDILFVPHNGSIGSAGLYVPSRLGGRLHCNWAFYQFACQAWPGAASTRSNGIVGVGTAEKLRYNPHRVKRDLSQQLACDSHAISSSNSDLYSGVVDPAFYLHHTMVDRMYWLWQALHWSQAKTISDNITFGNSPPTRNATLKDIIDVLFLVVEPTTHGSLLDALDGPYCCEYA